MAWNRRRFDPYPSARRAETVFEEVLQVPPDMVQARLFTAGAFKYGAPPHGGIALGFRIVLSRTLCHTPSTAM